MKKVVLLAFTVIALSGQNALASEYVHGYTRHDGTYVQPHYRSDSNGSAYDNYSTRGNSNPYTGERGYVDPYNSNLNRSHSPGSSLYDSNDNGWLLGGSGRRR